MNHKLSRGVARDRDFFLFLFNRVTTPLLVISPLLRGALSEYTWTRDTVGSVFNSLHVSLCLKKNVYFVRWQQWDLGDVESPF